MKLLQTIQLDDSDAFIFPAVAKPGEWAVPGAFAFLGGPVAALEGKERAAFRAGFLGVTSLGWSTLAQIVDATGEDRARAVAQLTKQLVARFGAPDFTSAHRAADEEIDFAASLCTHPTSTLIALHRSDEDGVIREAFRSLGPRGDQKPSRAFALLDAVGKDDPDDALNVSASAATQASVGDRR